ncbi:MAG: ATP-grasp domain-containing protein [Planctomycetota bacterium]|nr:ATP-grasp domain-containing protein [Planctomycetota bacterium]
MNSLTDDTNPLRILVAEYLLANAGASSTAAKSMLDEASVMLAAVVSDIAQLPDVTVTVLLSAGSDASFRKSRTNTHILRAELQPETLTSILCGDSAPSAFDAVLLIAPECNGILVSLLKTVQQNHVSPIRSFNLDWQLAEVFSDKRATDAWLRQHGIATIPTRTIDDATAEALHAAASQNLFIQTDPSQTHQYAVLKPRDGAGAEDVRIVPYSQRSLLDLPHQFADNDRWILQPFMPGVACSIGFIGGGQHGSTTILPPARQTIVATDGSFSYHGGEIPCEPAIASRIEPVAKQLAAAFGSFDGYVGADLLVDLSAPQDSATSVVVVEINPRLCTSYVGYRVLAVDNLADVLLQRRDNLTIQWKRQVVSFRVNEKM